MTENNASITASDIEKIIITDKIFREISGIDMIRPEAYLTLMLAKHGPLSIKEAMTFTRTSYRGFYTVLNRLLKAGIVKTTTDAADKRVRMLALVDDHVGREYSLRRSNEAIDGLKTSRQIDNG